LNASKIDDGFVINLLELRAALHHNHNVKVGASSVLPEAKTMIGMVLVTHGRLASEFRSALEHVVGPQKQVGVITIEPDDDMDGRRQDIMDAIHAVDSGDGVVVLTDMFGGTPSNLAISAMNGSNVEVVAGINLPMLIKLASVRDEQPLGAAVLQAQEAGRKYINIASRVLSAK
jgi:mannose PTS system EIIA component